MSRDYKKIPSEKQFNQDKLIDISCSIYDWQFKRFKNRVERERYRDEYDVIKAKLEAIDHTMKVQKEKPTMSEGEIARLPDEKLKMEKDLLVYKEKIDQCDKDLSGVQESYEKNEKGELVRDEKGLPVYVAPTPGIETMIEALRELKNVHIAYIKIV